jgi:hypothetical protein
MKTNLKVILAAAAITVVTSPVLAQSSGILTVSPEDWQQATAPAQHVATPPKNIERAHAQARFLQPRLPAHTRRGH